MSMLAHYADVSKSKKEKPLPPKAARMQITITVNTHFLDRLDALGRDIGRNRSEMIDRAIEEYIERRGDRQIST